MAVAINLVKLANSPLVNYLHYGEAFEGRPELLPRGGGFVGDRDLPQQTLRESLEWRKQFHALGCRGFSYELDLEMKHYDVQHDQEFLLGSGINLRIALMAGDQLFYPPRVKKYFSTPVWWRNHYVRKNMPSVAFCLGKQTGPAWYVFVMQSDLASKGPSCVREHFRGWRMILFANVVAQAHGKTGALYLCRAEDVERASLRIIKGAGRVPDRWRSIYDRTAEQWGMPLVKLSEPVNVQIYPRRKPVYSEYFYELQLTGESEFSLAGQQERLCTVTR